MATADINPRMSTATDVNRLMLSTKNYPH
uniref:Uncharacterized protein n=1 Tax=Anguilla anguilla TaxID=7936 RepID=A0A0E9PUR3_ANGAN